MHLSRTLSHRSRSGSTLIAALIICVLVASIAGYYLESVRLEIKQTHRTRLQLEAVNLAEIGVEDGLYALINNDWSGWNSGTAGYSRRIPSYSSSPSDPTAIPNGIAGETRFIDVFVRTSDVNQPVIVAEANLHHNIGIDLSRQIRIDFSRGGMFMNGLTARDQVDMNGNTVAVDSYNSGSGIYDAVSNRNDNGSVASVSVEVAAVDIQNADILGFVATGGAAPSVGKNGSILGFDSPVGTRIDTSRVTTDFYAEFPPVEAPTLSAPTTTVPSSNGTYYMANDYELNSFTVSTGQTFHVTAPITIVVDGGMTVKGEIIIDAGASLELYVKGDLDIGGNGVTNIEPGNVPADCIIYGTADESSGQTIKWSGNGASQMALYAPNADVEMKGSGASGVVYGAVVANNILLTGNFEFHYDEALRDFDGDGGYTMDEWRELDRAVDQYNNVLALKDGGL